MFMQQGHIKLTKGDIKNIDNVTMKNPVIK